MKDRSHFHYPFIAVLSLFLLVSCAQNKSTAHSYKSYHGKPLPDSEIAILTFGERVKEFYVDGIRVKHTDYGSIELKPGVHEIRWKYRFAVSALVNSTGWDEIEATTSIYLQAGHSYSVNADRTIGHGYRMILWICDETSGKRIFAKEV